MKSLDMRGVTRSYGKGERSSVVLDKLTLEIAPGEIVALLGPNGAGKTTTVKIASTLLLPDEGSVKVCGVDALANPRKACARTSLLLGGERGFYQRVSARENLLFFAALEGVSSADAPSRVEEALDAVGLAGRARDKVETFSRGMRQRLHIARTLLSRPGLILLDEPTSGLDPESAASVRGLVRDLRSEGVGILLTTHSMAEAEELSDRITILERGRTVASGTIGELAGMVRVASVVTYNSLTPPHDAVQEFEGASEVRMISVTEKNGSWDIDIGWDGEGDVPLPKDALQWRLVGTRPPSLEEIYLAILHESRENRQEV